MTSKEPWGAIDCNEMSEMLKKGLDKVFLIDSRSFLEYNTCHIGEAVNVCCSKLVKRRLQQDKISVRDLLSQTCNVEMISANELIVYDQCSTDTSNLSLDCFLIVLLQKLVKVFKKVSLLTGGFLEFQACHPSLCENKMMTTSGQHKVPAMSSMSQPCMPVANLGPTKILPFLYLGSQQDALSHETMKKNGITYMLNVSTTCPHPAFIQEGHFLRIPVNDNYSDKLLPYFQDAFQFLDKVREANGCVLVHCLAGISRSPTLAIAYIMTHLGLNTEEAYKYVKDKRPTISPNFNFLGQLTEYENQLKQKASNYDPGSPVNTAQKKKCIAELRSPSSPSVATPRPPLMFSLALQQRQPMTGGAVQSPTTALSKLSFTSPSPVLEDPPVTPGSDTEPSPLSRFNQFSTPTKSLGEVCFTPCFTPCLAKEETHRMSRGRKGSGGSGGTKRPFSVGSSEEEERTFDCGKPMGCHKPPAVEQITMRSPESKAKRTPTRPNSIAFSSYPLFDLSSDSDALPGPCRVRSASRERGRSAPRSASPVRQAEKENSTTNCLRHVELRLQGSAVEGTGNVQAFEQARKSRSMEDIIASPDDTYDILGGVLPPSTATGTASSKWNHNVHVPDTFSQAMGLDNIKCWYRGPPEIHQSNSSISSTGSRNSLHGSMEMIQVS